MKRCFDLILIVPGFLLLLPMMSVLGVLVRIILGSPVVFVQLRPGLHGKLFAMYKFRTMTDERNEDGELLPDSERMTRLGSFLRQTSLDELPALFNVLKGDMSLVGPRPLLPEYLPLYNCEQARRHEVLPGITGWAQVNGRNAVTWEERFRLDLWYVENRTLWLDVKILWLTLFKVFKREGINAAGEATMSKFRGNADG